MKNYLLLLLLFLSTSAWSQVTTSSLGGDVKDNAGALPGATILATHVPSGTVYGAAVSADGRYSIVNMRVGGPYKVKVSFVGYANAVKEDIYLELGQRLELDFNMVKEGVSMDEIVITGTKNTLINGDRTGPATTISAKQINNLPTISRSASDYTRMNPMSAEGGSFAGRNDQFNNYSLDGMIFNNPFGLDAATPGGQSNAQPVSLDAIEQISVAIAPYDVTQSGFTGASINSVSKSGTNTIKGTAYGFFRNESLTGGRINGEKIFKGQPKQTQMGVSIGGPIVKNKVFFFANFEKEDRSDLGSLWSPQGGTLDTEGNVSRVTAADMLMVSNLLRDRYGYETGAIEGFTHEADNIKGLFKLDFNLGQNHQLSTTYNFLQAYRDNPAHPSAIGRRGPDFTTLQFENSGYRINNNLQQARVELKSRLGDKMANKFTVGYTQFRDSRDPKSAPFPVLNISQDGQRYIIAGHEPFSVHNVLDQDVYQIKNDLSIFLGKHNLTIGAALEKFEFNNSFNLTSYGFRVFSIPGIDIDDFEDFINSGGLDAEVAFADSVYTANNAADAWALAETNMGQFSVYAQDDIAISDKFNLTLGVRVDIPNYYDTSTKIEENIDRNCCYDPTIVYSDEEGNPVTFDHTTLPSTDPLINPRLGFNYDVYGDRSTQVRGGTGLFSGRFPFVWIGNQVANPNFFFYNMTDPNFKFPQVWRSSLGFDKKLGKGWVSTVDLLYTKDLQAQVVNNYGLKLPTEVLSGPGARPVYGANDRVTVFGDPTNAYVFTNVDGGQSFNVSLAFERSWKNNFMKLAYNFLDATDVMSIDAEISSDAYDRNPANIEHTNKPLLSPSLYGNKHRLVGIASRTFPWENDAVSTTVSVFFEYAQGNRYSYTYAGDINNDGSTQNDLIYIPTEAQIGEMTFSGTVAEQQSQMEAFNAYILQDPYLIEHRGNFAEKYGALSPWYNTWDMRILQDIGLWGENKEKKLQISLDILNIGNLINSNWGVRQFATTTSLTQPLAVSVTDAVPVYTFDEDLKTTFFNDFSVNSRWRMQIGARVIF